MSNKKKAARSKKQKEMDKIQRGRILLLTGTLVSVRWVQKVRQRTEHGSTHFHEVKSCSDENLVKESIDVLGNIVEIVYNKLGSVGFWHQNSSRSIEKVLWDNNEYDPVGITVGGFQLYKKPQEWAIRDTYDNILANRAAAKKEIIKNIKQLPRFKKEVARGKEELSKDQVTRNKEIDTEVKNWIKALDNGIEEIVKIPTLNRLVRKHFHRGHSNQHRQIVLMSQGYSCERINRSTVRVTIQGLLKGNPIVLEVKSRRIISGCIRLIYAEDGSLWIYSFVKLCYFPNENRKGAIAADRGFTEVLCTDEKQFFGNDFGEKMVEACDRMTKKEQNKNRLRKHAEKLQKTDPEKASRIEKNNLGDLKEARKKQQEDSTVDRIINTATKQAISDCRELITESLVDEIPTNKKYSKSTKRRISSWRKGRVIDRVEELTDKYGVKLTLVNAAYTSQIDHRNGTLLGFRIKGSGVFVTYDGVRIQDDYNAAVNIKVRSEDEEIDKYEKYRNVESILLKRTAQYLRTKYDISLTDAVDKGWLDPKHKECKDFKEINDSFAG